MSLPTEQPRHCEHTHRRNAFLRATEQLFNQSSDLAILRHCLGLERLQHVPGFLENISSHLTIVCLDCEHWSNNSDELTQIGLAVFTMEDLQCMTDPTLGSIDYGDHGKNLMKLIKFNLLRIAENSHLPSAWTNPNNGTSSKGVDGNRFGYANFTTFAEARQALERVFKRPMTSVPGLDNCDYPVILLGQDIGHDKTNLKDKDLRFDLKSLGTVVREIDTQHLAREVGLWPAVGDNPRNQIGLDVLVKRLEFLHTDPHTALNDAARTLESAIQLVLTGHKCKMTARLSMQQVANTIETHSRISYATIGGCSDYCWRCGGRDHMKPNCKVHASELRCDYCASNGYTPSLDEAHISEHCIHEAEAKAEARRNKYREIKAEKARLMKEQRNRSCGRGCKNSLNTCVARSAQITNPNQQLNPGIIPFQPWSGRPQNYITGLPHVQCMQQPLGYPAYNPPSTEWPQYDLQYPPFPPYSNWNTQTSYGGNDGRFPTASDQPPGYDFGHYQDDHSGQAQSHHQGGQAAIPRSHQDSHGNQAFEQRQGKFITQPELPRGYHYPPDSHGSGGRGEQYPWRRD